MNKTAIEAKAVPDRRDRIGVRVPEPLYAKLETYAREMDLTATSAARRIAREFARDMKSYPAEAPHLVRMYAGTRRVLMLIPVTLEIRKSLELYAERTDRVLGRAMVHVFAVFLERYERKKQEASAERRD